MAIIVMAIIDMPVIMIGMMPIIMFIYWRLGITLAGEGKTTTKAG